jgi:hypothetical protein
MRPAAAPAEPGATAARHANQWEVIFDKVRRVAAPKYKVESILGFGGMAGVYLAQEPRLGRQVAIKVMSPALMVDPKLVDRFVQEARTIAALSHPNIVTIYEVDEREELHWFAMTYVAGRTLGQVMADATRPMPIPVVRAWLYQIGDALAYAHHHGIVHRDIKPGNVLLDLRGNALVTDFGIAKVADVEAGLTRTGMLVGTPAYMSPEQCSSGRVTGASDQYSLGAVAYQMLTGQPPFAGPTLSVLQAHVAQEPVPIRELRPDCPDDLLAAVQRMLDKRVEDRWPSMSAAIAAANASPPGLDGPVREQLELLAAQAAGITVSPWFDIVREGTREKLSVLVVDAGGRVLPARRVEWKSSDLVVAGVSDDSKLQAFAPGTTYMMATCGAAEVTLPLTVESDPIRDIEVDPADATVRGGGQVKLDAIVHDWDGERLEDRAVLWSSSDATVARVLSDGTVEGVTRGTAVITASTGGKAAAANITVSEAASARPKGGSARATLHPPRTPAPAVAEPAARAEPAREAPAQAHRPAVVVGPARPARTGSRKGLYAGVGAAVIGVAAIALVITRPWQQPVVVEDPPPPVVTQGTVDVPQGTLPEGAVITLRDASGQARLVTESALTLDAGTYTLAFEAPGHERDLQTITVRAGETLQYSPMLRALPVDPPPDNPPDNPPPVVEGAIEVMTANLPVGAAITMRDAAGRTRTVSGGRIPLPPGSYTFEFRAPRHEPDRQTIMVRAGQTQRYVPAVQALPDDPPPPPVEGTVEIAAANLPAGATITLREPGGQTRAVSGRTLSLPPGTYSFEFRAPGHEADQQTIVVRSRETQRYAPVVRATPTRPDPPPTRDTSADVAAIETAIRDFVAAFHRRDANTVVPLLPQAQQSPWRTLLNERTVTDWRVTLGSQEAPRFESAGATASFVVRVSFRVTNQTRNQELSYTGTFDRSSGTWRIASLRTN